MKAEIVPARTSRELVQLRQINLPVAITAAGRKASHRFILISMFIPMFKMIPLIRS